MKHPQSAPMAGLFGLAGLALNDEEKRFFAGLNPLGFILFARNCESPAQVKALTASLKECVGREVLILIDQEGGRVARLKPPHWRKAPAAAIFNTAGISAESKKQAVYANARLIARELFDLGITVDCAPLADVPVAGAHDIIGDRAYSYDPEEVAILAGEMARGLSDGGVLPVLKHIPGHGRARSDSHEELPVVDVSLDVLRKSDFIPFHALRSLPLGMTAHILYTAIDAKKPATLSSDVLQLVRKEIGFDGLLMSDDISMKALKGDLGALTQASLAAGCDVVLHCNGKMEEMRAVADALPVLGGPGQERLARALTQLKPPIPYDYQAAERRLTAMKAA